MRRNNTTQRHYSTRTNGNHNGNKNTHRPQWQPSETLTLAQMQTILPSLPVDNKKKNSIQTIIDKTKKIVDKGEAEFRLQKIFQLPWGIHRKSAVNIHAAQDILNKKIFGMHQAKERILDTLALRHMNPSGHGDTLCFVGAPGTGKTALAEIIADTLNLPCGHISLAGAHNDEIIRGSLGVYKEAAEGELAKILVSCGISNPIIILDEIDKVSNREGSPSGSLQSALLQLLDPTQNHHFFDNYLGIAIDVSKVTFVATANYVENLSEPLKNRLNIIPVRSYTPEDKVKIATDFILPKLNLQTGLLDKKIPITLSNEVMHRILSHHTPQEHGVRQLEKMIKILCAKQAREYLTNKKTLNFSTENIKMYLAQIQEENYKKLIW